MENNTQLPAEVTDQIKLNAEAFANKHINGRAQPDVWEIVFKSHETAATAYASKLQEVQQENEQLRGWKMEAAELLTKIHSYAHKHLEIKLGESIVDFVIAMAKERDELKQENADLKKKLSEWELEAYEVRGQTESLEKSAIRQNEAFEELRTSHRLMSKAYAEALIERDELKRQNDKLKEKATGWRPLLEEVLGEDTLRGTISTQTIENIKKYLYGE